MCQLQPGPYLGVQLKLCWRLVAEHYTTLVFFGTGIIMTIELGSCHVNESIIWGKFPFNTFHLQMLAKFRSGNVGGLKAIHAVTICVAIHSYFVHCELVEQI